MFAGLFQQLRIAITLLLIITVITGLIYPGVVTGFAQVFFSWRANGSLITVDEKIVGSELLGQFFTSPKYFWSRPSATLPFPYNATASSGSNLGPTNPNLLAVVKARIEHLQQADPGHLEKIPIELVTASGSGLDPEISPAAAYYQVHRVAKARHLPEEQVKQLLDNSIKRRTLGVLGEPRLNVLQLNLNLDALEKNTHH